MAAVISTPTHAQTPASYHQRLAQYTQSVMSIQTVSAGGPLQQRAQSQSQIQSETQPSAHHEPSIDNPIASSNMPTTPIFGNALNRQIDLSPRIESEHGSTNGEQDSVLVTIPSVSTKPVSETGHAGLDSNRAGNPPLAQRERRAPSQPGFEPKHVLRHSSCDTEGKHENYEARRAAKRERHRGRLEEKVGSWLKGILEAVAQDAMIVEAPLDIFEHVANLSAPSTGPSSSLPPFSNPGNQRETQAGPPQVQIAVPDFRSSYSHQQPTPSDAIIDDRHLSSLLFSTKVCKATLKSPSLQIQSRNGATRNEEKEWFLSVLNDSGWAAHLNNGVVAGTVDGAGVLGNDGSITRMKHMSSDETGTKHFMVIGTMPTPKAVAARSTFWG